MLALAHHLQPEPLGGRGRRVGRGLHYRCPAIVVEEVGDGQHALGPQLALLHGVQRRGEGGQVRGIRIHGGATAHGRRHPPQQRGRRVEQGDALGAQRRFAQLERVRGALRGLEHVGERRMILHAGNAAERAHPAQHVARGVAIARSRDEQLEPRADVRRLRREIAVLPAGRGHGERGGGAMRRELGQLGAARPGAGGVVLRPRARIAQECLALVHCGDQRGAERGAPLELSLAQRASHAFETGGHLGERRDLGHGRAAAQGTRDALQRVDIGHGRRAGR